MSPTPPSPLADLHRQVDAETQPYDAVEIVATFGEPQAEYAAIRKSVGLLDLPQRGVIELTGRDRHSFLNNLVTNELVDKASKTPLAAGRWVYAFLLNLKGRIVCDVNLIELGERTLLEVDGRLVPMLVGLLDRYLFAEQVKVRDATADLYEIALHGPTVPTVLEDEHVRWHGRPARDSEPADTGGTPVPPAVGECFETSIIGVPVILWRDDVCGVPGLHLILSRDRVADVWQHLLTRHGGETAIGKRTLRPVGWAAFNAARIEAGRPLLGIDFELAPPSLPGKKADADADTEAAARPVGVLPAETSLLDRAVSFTKGCYLGQEVVARMHARSQVARQLVGLRIDDDALPIAGTAVLDAGQAVVGVVTSSTMSPILSDAAIALAVIRRPHFETGTRLLVAAEGAVRGATVTRLPFLKQDDA